VTARRRDAPSRLSNCRGSEEWSVQCAQPGAAAREYVLVLKSYRPRRHRSAGAAPEPRVGFESPVRPLPPVAPVSHDPATIAASPFAALGLTPPLVRAVIDAGYAQPTPVQAAVLRPALEGRDIIACAQTGTGKTAAFVLPILQRLAAAPGSGEIRALILTPTRELASQIAANVAAYGRYVPLRHTVIYGGVSQRTQEAALRSPPDLLIATPGRLLDLMTQRIVRLGGVGCLVRDVRRIAAALRPSRHTMLFSATMPPAIEALAKTMLVEPARVAIQPTVRTAVTVEQSVMFVARADKRAALERLLRSDGVERAIVFTRTKHGANRLCQQLERSGIGSAAIHGNKSQNARERALDAFRRGSTRVLVATDVAARGIDVEGVSHVINFDMPKEAESYVHRIGRTGRAGAAGRAISLCDRDERDLLLQIERLIRRPLTAHSS